MRTTIQPAILLILAAAFSGCFVAPAAADELSATMVHIDDASVDERAAVFCETPANCANCVFYARCRKPNLPYGLWSLADKVAIINSDIPQSGAVAVIDSGLHWGHLAYVEAVNGTILTISEGNWVPGQCGQRQGTVEGLKILGFFI